MGHLVTRILLGCLVVLARLEAQDSPPSQESTISMGLPNVLSGVSDLGNALGLDSGPSVSLEIFSICNGSALRAAPQGDGASSQGGVASVPSEPQSGSASGNTGPTTMADAGTPTSASDASASSSSPGPTSSLPQDQASPGEAGPLA